MVSEFKNQLTRTEIIKGLFICINKKLRYVIFLCMLVAGQLVYISRNSLKDGLLAALAIAVIAEVF